MPSEILDSSCWIEYFNGSPLGERFAALVEDGDHLLGVEHGLPLADSVIYATARAHGATLHTLDADFEGLPGVEVITRDAG